MARKTRKEALVTRELLLSAAENLFLSQGVTHTSLNQIACAANVTRGAIYWHFKDKVDLLQALLDHVSHPVDEIISQVINNPTLSPEEKILALISEISALLSTNERLRNTITIMTYKVELVDEFAAMHDRHMLHFTRMLNIYRNLIEEEFKRRKLPINNEQIHTIARTVYAIVFGLFHHWILLNDTLNYKNVTIHAVQTYFNGLWNTLQKNKR